MVGRIDLLFAEIDRANGNHPRDKMVRVRAFLEGYFQVGRPRRVQVGLTLFR